MKNKRWWKIFFVIILVVIIGISGKVYIETKKERKIIEVERQSIVALKNTFANISEVEIEKSVYDKKTGTYGIYVMMRNRQNNLLKFMYHFEKNDTVVYGFVIKDRSIQKVGETKDKITVKFSNGTQEKM